MFRFIANLFGPKAPPKPRRRRTYVSSIDPAKVRSLRAGGLKQHEIARRLGIGQTSVSRILRRNKGS